MSTSTPKNSAKQTAESLPNPILLKVKEEPMDESMNSTEEIWKEFEENDLVEVTKEPENQNVAAQNKRTYEDCPDCLNFIRDYGDEFSKEVIQKRIEKCTRHNRDELDLNLTPEGFWDPFIASLPANDKRREVLIDTRFVDRKK